VPAGEHFSAPGREMNFLQMKIAFAKTAALSCD
jgi:hypothetical protein